MYIHAYLRASTIEQNVFRAKKRLNDFVQQKGCRVAGWFMENESGATLQRPELMRLLNDAMPGDVVLVEQIDRLSRLNTEGWEKLKAMLSQKNLKVVALDLPTSHMFLHHTDDHNFNSAMACAMNNMMMDMLAAIARKDYEDRRVRQAEGIRKAKEEGKYKGRQPDLDLHDKIFRLRANNMSIKETAMLTGASKRTVTRVTKAMRNKQKST